MGPIECGGPAPLVATAGLEVTEPVPGVPGVPQAARVLPAQPCIQPTTRALHKAGQSPGPSEAVLQPGLPAQLEPPAPHRGGEVPPTSSVSGMVQVPVELATTNPPPPSPGARQAQNPASFPQKPNLHIQLLCPSSVQSSSRTWSSRAGPRWCSQRLFCPGHTSSVGTQGKK